MITVDEVADYVLYYFHNRGEDIVHLKLQKLVYYIQAWYLAIYDEPLVDASFQAWVHGSVQPSLYKRFRRYGWEPINCNTIECPQFDDEEVVQHIDKVLLAYGKFSARQLELMIQDEDPWKNARRGLDELDAGNREISAEDMKEYYRRTSGYEDEVKEVTL